MNPPLVVDPFDAVWLLVAFSLGGLISLIRVSGRRFRFTQVAEVARQEDGAAYTISYVMVIPFYALLLAIVIETAAVLPAKLGTVYAAYSAARTASVWSSATDWENAKSKASWAAQRAFVPFASATQGVSVDAVAPETVRYLAAVKQFADQPASDKYLVSKIAYARQAIKLSIDRPATWNSEIKATVEYEFPFNVPGVARIFGQRRADGSIFFPLRSTVILQNEGPQTSSATSSSNALGIGYGTLE